MSNTTSVNSKNNKTKYIDYLDEDDIIMNQQWVCISFLSPEGIKNCNIRGLKIRGVYPTQERANERAKELQDKDSDFHVFVGEVGKWLAWDPDVNSVEDHVYQDEQLNDLMRGYKENLKKTAKMEQERKSDKLKGSEQVKLKPLEKENSGKETSGREENLDKIKNRMKNKLAQIKKSSGQTNNIVSDEPKLDMDPSNIDVSDKMLDVEQNILNHETSIDTKDTIVKSKSEELNKIKSDLEKQKNITTDINDQLSKIKSLYEKLNKK